MSGYLLALAVTLAIEVPVVAALFAGQRLRMAVVAALATTATHLAMHFALPHVVSTYVAWLVAGELLALVVEAAAYALLSRPRSVERALVASAVANALSFGAGLALF